MQLSIKSKDLNKFNSPTAERHRRFSALRYLEWVEVPQYGEQIRVALAKRVEWLGSPDAPQPADVLAAVKDKALREARKMGLP